MNVLELMQPVRAFVLDVDGVLTDGSLILLDDGQQARTMHIRDGYALQLAIKKGYHVIVISGAVSEAVKTRLNRLGVQEVFMGVKNKHALLKERMQALGLKPAQVLFMGDDMPDCSVMQLAGVPCCPADAVAEIIQQSVYISPYNGGKGCVRDVIEKVLKLNNDWGDEEIAAR